MKKIIAIVLSAAMVMCFMPAMAFAAATDLGTTAAITATIDQNADLTYTGSEVKPAVAVKNGTTTLTEGTDYTVSYADNTNVGEATATVTGKGDFAGTKEVKFNITAKSFTNTSKPEITIPAQIVGTTTVAGIVIKWNSMTLAEGTDYEVAQPVAALTAGSQTTTVTFKGNYSGSCEASYDVNSGDFTKCALYVTSETYIFDGTAKEPAVSVRDEANKLLTQGTDYTVSYENNVNAGTATVKVIGKGAYAGTITKDFTVNKAKLSDARLVISPENYPYTGKAVTPTYTVTFGTYTLKTSDYTAVLANNTASGKATLTLTGAGNFDGTTLKGEFTIAGTDIGTLTASLDKTSYPYTGTAIEPVVTVKDGTTALTKGTDYTTTYKDNIKAGTGTVTLTGIGKYAGTKTIEFAIDGKDNIVTTTYASYTKYLTSQTFNLNARATAVGTGLTYASSDETVATVSAAGDVTVVGIGTATITVATAGITDYDPASKAVTIKVVPKKSAYKLASTSKGKLKVTVTAKAEGATGVQIKYGRSGSYKTYRTTLSSKTFTKLKSGKVYYVKTRSYTKLADGSIIYGSWTTNKSVKVK